MDAGSCHAGSASAVEGRIGRDLGARSCPGRKRSGALIAKAIVEPSRDSPAVGGVAGTLTSWLSNLALQDRARFYRLLCTIGFD